MPFYDLKCSECNRLIIDKFETVNESRPNCGLDTGCPGILERAWLPGKTSSVIGDEIDVTIKHGLCNPDGSPRRYRSRIEMNKVAKERKLVNQVCHKSEEGSDKSKHTSRWI